MHQHSPAVAEAVGAACGAGKRVIDDADSSTSSCISSSSGAVSRAADLGSTLLGIAHQSSSNSSSNSSSAVPEALAHHLAAHCSMSTETDSINNRSAGTAFIVAASESGQAVSSQLSLFAAAQAGDLATIKQLISAGAAVSFAVPETGQRALHVAAQHGNAAAVHALLSGLADVDAVDFKGTTALHLSAQNGYSTIVRELLSVGASVHISNSTGSTALYLAVANDHTDVVVQLLKAGASPTACCTAGTGSTAAAAAQGLSASQLAVHQGSDDIIRAMIQHTQCLRETSAVMSVVWGCKSSINIGRSKPLAAAVTACSSSSSSSSSTTLAATVAAAAAAGEVPNMTEITKQLQQPHATAQQLQQQRLQRLQQHAPLLKSRSPSKSLSLPRQQLLEQLPFQIEQLQSAQQRLQQVQNHLDNPAGLPIQFAPCETSDRMPPAAAVSDSSSSSEQQQAQGPVWLKPGRLVINPVRDETLYGSQWRPAAPEGSNNCHHQLAAAIVNTTSTTGLAAAAAAAATVTAPDTAGCGDASAQLLFDWQPQSPRDDNLVDVLTTTVEAAVYWSETQSTVEAAVQTEPVSTAGALSSMHFVSTGYTSIAMGTAVVNSTLGGIESSTHPGTLQHYPPRYRRQCTTRYCMQYTHRYCRQYRSCTCDQWYRQIQVPRAAWDPGAAAQLRRQQQQLQYRLCRQQHLYCSQYNGRSPQVTVLLQQQYSTTVGLGTAHLLNLLRRHRHLWIRRSYVKAGGQGSSLLAVVQRQQLDVVA